MNPQNSPKHSPGRHAADSSSPSLWPASCSSPSGARKRTYKEKFHDKLQAAEEEHIKAIHQQGLQDRKSLSIAMLVQGRAQAFVDFFMLIHQPQQQLASEAASEGPGGSAELSLQSLILLQEQLIRADAASRAAQHEQAFDADKTLAKHFTQLGMLDKAVFFWKKCLQVATSAVWPPGELEANCVLGLLYEALQHPQLAMACHERCLQLAQQLQRHEDAATAHAQLVQVYAQKAEQSSRHGDTAAAAEFYTKCRDAALQCSDAASAGAAEHHLGLIAQQHGDWQEAMQHQRSYLELSRQAGDAEAEGRACAAYADCQQQLGDLAGAVESLEAYLALPRSQDHRGQATACCQLGVLYGQQDKLEQAVSYFERFYELARSLGERRLLEVARVNLGVARSALLLPGYSALAWGNLQALLRWKSTRQGLQ